MGNPPPVRLATFNLLHGVPVRDGMSPPPVDDAGQVVMELQHTDDGALRRSVAELNADIIGVQEVDVGQPRSGGHHQVAVVAEAAGAEHWRFAASVRGTPGVRGWAPATPADESGPGEPGRTGPLYGVGLVSRLPVLRWGTQRFAPSPFGLPLLVPAHPRPRFIFVRDEPRAAIAAVVTGPSGPFTVATVHLSFVPGFNVRQLRQLRTWLADWPRPLILLGDFNLPGSLPGRVTGWTELAQGPTYPSTGPKVQFDHALADGLNEQQLRTATATIHRLEASDHCAVSVALSL